MAKDREMPCEFYVSAGECKKGRKAIHKGYCQKCNKYIPRAKVATKNKKSIKLEKIRAKESRRVEY